MNFPESLLWASQPPPSGRGHRERGWARPFHLGRLLLRPRQRRLRPIRLEENLDLMADLGIQAYRFSVAWPRIQPEGSGPARWKGLDRYRRLVDGLRERRIVPKLTLYYWNQPQAFEDRGGWKSRETSERFAEYAGIVYEALQDNVPFWITQNEPWVCAWLGVDGDDRRAVGGVDDGMRPPARRGVGRRVGEEDEEDENTFVSERRQTSMRGEDKS